MIRWLCTMEEFKGIGGDQLRLSWTNIARMRGNAGPTGFGGLLRDHERNILLSYSGLLGVNDLIAAEVMGLLHGIHIFTSQFTGPLDIEGDASVVISWGKYHTESPWKFVYHFREIFNLLMQSSCA
ncbi:hypothetical protein H6P81_011320 [Aristolochia fimbriata]|uniref:RNase H type-1 domain-containing protein n=1 Tax=Aristolochia fimbriata TaxID=158543 RepID=A0AAV7ER54_ARIFI|nr:hypothetical protein H6P81_011320 [Aristolochia fimbriata]